MTIGNPPKPPGSTGEVIAGAFPSSSTGELITGAPDGSAPPWEQEPQLKPRGLSWEELLDLPPSDYLVKGILHAGSLGLLYGPTSCGKSFLALDLALHLVLGRDWLGHRVRQSGVLYCNLEAGAGIINRLLAFDQAVDKLGDLDFRCVISATNLLDPVGATQVILDASQVADLGLVIIDTAARATAGSAEGPDDFSLLVKACDRIRDETGATVLLVHHTGKDGSKGSRGSTVLPAAVDSIIDVTPNPGGPKSVTLEKSRDGAIGELFAFSLDVIEIGKDDEGDPITSCVVRSAESVPKSETGPTLTDRQRRALNQLANILADHGELAPNTTHYPAGTKVVSVDLFQETLRAAGVVDPKGKNPRTDFRRLLEQLITKGKVGQWDERVWLV